MLQSAGITCKPFVMNSCVCHHAMSLPCFIGRQIKTQSSYIVNSIKVATRTLHMKLVEGGPKLAIIRLVSGFILHTAAGLGSGMLYW
jgi:hypothetical protein